MTRENLHPTDQDLLLEADGELSAHHSAEIRAHLDACWDCRARMAEVEATIADFARAYRRDSDSPLPSIEGPRALLRARLDAIAAESRGNLWQRFLRFDGPIGTIAFACALLFIAAVFGKFAYQIVALRSTAQGVGASTDSIDRGVVPDRKLTPGMTRAVAMHDVCSVAREEVVRAVPATLQQQILREYGLLNARANDYEIDYLIAPGLGGAEDIRNLWPEPYKSATWNARVKDDLEEYLHESVCAGKLDLSTAQRDISTDWIAAYKKYFHTDKPLAIQLNAGSFEADAIPRFGFDAILDPEAKHPSYWN